MPGNSSIRYLSNREIDKAKWDSCIDTASNSLIYGYSFYLDHMAKNWDALVLNDYEFVMPLPWNSKYSIRYVYQPFLTAQLGIFGNRPSSDLTLSFINAIPSSFRLVELSLNSTNNLAADKRLFTRKNFVLDLSKSYEELAKAYSDNTKRNLKKALSLRCNPVKDIPVEKIIDLALAQMKEREKGSGNNVSRFRKLYDNLQSKRMAVTYGIEQGGEIISSAVFFLSSNRAYYLLVGNHPDGRGMGASHYLIDTFIRDHAGNNMILDFEGSDRDSLAMFYGSFGAINVPYPFLKINRLPFFLKWIKK